MKQIIEHEERMQTGKQKADFKRFIGFTLPTLSEPWDNILVDLNIMIFYIKGYWILSFYIHKNPNKEKKPLLNGELQI